ncbi:restriction endonuclease subunit S [Flavobacterium oreochromis]|uniref:restriction endonuclease subunit S n=1 Tax=Flavobacterium oreochromis TaxID=2906078 RepID=UPI001CE5183C|nr:restriction endonuclease subunit S [Flavobacterium oreochromis]QYS86102.1 restriction endonuclease subunit S [Flavobacterium oreochromis]
MMNNINKYKYLNFFDFHSLITWDVKKNIFESKLEFENSVKLSEILKIHRKPVSRKEVEKNQYQIISKIDFGGNLFLREFDEIKNYKGNLFEVPKNSIIYSKINVRHGCIYYNDLKPFVVSNEYPCFIFNDNIINADFLILLLRSSYFKKQLDSLKVGVGKARVKIEEFLSVTIPLPSIEEQKKLVEDYQNKKQIAEHLENEAKNLKNELDYQLGISNIKIESNVGKLNFVDFKLIEKWGLDQIFKSHTKYNGKFKTVKVIEICSVSSGGTPSRNNKSYYNGNIPWIKTGEVLDDVIFDTEEKITSEAIKNSSAKLYPKGSLIIAMYGQGKTRGRTAKLGIDATTNQACAVLFNINNEIVITDYLWIYLMNEYERMRELATGNNQPNLNADMIKNYPVVIPPMDIQLKIIEEYNIIKNKQNQNLQNAEALRKEAIINFENAIFN